MRSSTANMSRGIEGHFRPEFVLLTFDKPTDAGTWIFCGFWWEDDDAVPQDDNPLVYFGTAPINLQNEKRTSGWVFQKWKSS